MKLDTMKKMSLFFSRNTKDEMKEFAQGIFGAQIIQHVKHFFEQNKICCLTSNKETW